MDKIKKISFNEKFSALDRPWFTPEVDHWAKTYQIMLMLNRIADRLNAIETKDEK